MQNIFDLISIPPGHSNVNFEPEMIIIVKKDINYGAKKNIFYSESFDFNQFTRLVQKYNFVELVSNCPSLRCCLLPCLLKVQKLFRFKLQKKPEIAFKIG